MLNYYKVFQKRIDQKIYAKWYTTVISSSFVILLFYFGLTTGGEKENKAKIK